MFSKEKEIQFLAHAIKCCTEKIEKESPIERQQKQIDEVTDFLQIKCDNCDDNTASIFCQSCQSKLCSFCDDDCHRIKLFSKHIRQPINEITQPKQSVDVCKLHDKTIDLYCQHITCLTPICYYCSVIGRFTLCVILLVINH